jgi:hypothetical protein
MRKEDMDIYEEYEKYTIPAKDVLEIYRNKQDQEKYYQYLKKIGKTVDDNISMKELEIYEEGLIFGFGNTLQN